MKKGQVFKNKANGIDYAYVGKWCGSYVMAPVDGKDDQCIIYDLEELKEEMEQQ
jgi:hypothetical protein